MNNLNRALALCVALAIPLTSDADAQIRRHTLTGTVTGTSSAGYFSSVLVGDPVTLVFDVDTQASPNVINSPYYVRYNDAIIATSVSLGLVTTEPPLMSSTVEVIDDRPLTGFAFCDDEYLFRSFASANYDWIFVTASQTSFSAPCPTLLSSTEIPATMLAGSATTYFSLSDGAGLVSGQITSETIALLTENDACSEAIALPSGYSTTPFFATGATTDGADAAGFCDYGIFGDDQNHNDIWFTYTPDESGCKYITTRSLAGYDTRLTIYEGASCPDDPARIIACVDDEDQPTLMPYEAGLDVVMSAGQTYLIRLGTFSAATPGGSGSIMIAAGPGADVNSGGSNPGALGCLPVTNDDCANATVVTVGLTAVDNRLATDGAGLAIPSLVCSFGAFSNGQLYQDVWYSFTPPATAPYDIAVVNNGNEHFASRLAVYDQSTCPEDPQNVIGCARGGTAFNTSIDNLSLTVGQSYLIRFGSAAFNTLNERPGQLWISTTASVPANNDCAGATSISGYGSYPFDTGGASTTGMHLTGFCDFGSGNSQIEDDVWFEYTALVGGCTYISTLNNAGFDTRIAVYNSSTCPEDPATVLACSDDEVQPPTAPFEAGLDVDLTAGNTYLIRVGASGFFALDGPGTLVIAAGPVAASNDGGLQVGAPGCVSPSYLELCHGDGGDQMGCANCPCMNNAPQGTLGGCRNSANGSAHLTASGDSSVSLPSGDASDLRFALEGAPPNAFCILNSGDGVAPGNMANPCFGTGSGAQAAAFDGLRCAIMNTRRHGGRSADSNGEVGVTNNPWGGEGGPPVGLAVAGGGFAAGQTRYFQVINRDDALAVCMRGLNTSQAVEVLFAP